MNKIELKDLNDLNAGYVLEVINHNHNDETQWFMVHQMEDNTLCMSTDDGEHYIKLNWVRVTDDFKIVGSLGWDLTILRVYGRCRTPKWSHDVSNVNREVLWNVDEVKNEVENGVKTINKGDIVRIVGNTSTEYCGNHEFDIGTICVVEIDEFSVDGTYLVSKVNGGEDYWVNHTDIELV